jgi:hypothetical protein
MQQRKPQMYKPLSTACVLLAAGLAGCTTIPDGPGVMALPGSGASFDRFRADDFDCQSYARQTTGIASPQQAAEQSAVRSAVVGTAVGAAAGALMGAAGGDAGAGAAMGAGSGLIVGSAAGSGAYGTSAWQVQERYDAAYVQCMYAKGHQVPVPASVAAQQSAPAWAAAPPPAAPSSYPPPNAPPPPGYR